MILIGEKLVSSIPRTLAAMQARNFAALDRMIEKQIEAGARYLDVNTALLGEDELPMMLELIERIGAHEGAGVMIDSPSAKVLGAALKASAGMDIIVNSVTVTERIDELLPLIAGTSVGVVGMPVAERMPQNARERVENAERLISRLTQAGIPLDKIYIDCVVETLATDDGNPMKSIEAVRELRARYGDVHLIAGLSNISYGLPNRAALNAAFLAMAVGAGLDSAILDVTSAQMRLAIAATRAVAGEDEYSMDYIALCRELRNDGKEGKAMKKKSAAISNDYCPQTLFAYGTTREDGKANFEIRRLTPDRAEDYLRFFDTTPHSTGKDEHRCYCVCWAGEDCDGRDFSTAEKRRVVAAEYVKRDIIQGYLAYRGHEVVGWCNANTKSACYDCISWKMFMQAVKKDAPETKVKSIFCFAVAPEMREKGIATMLLHRVCDDAAKDGFHFVEAYPNREFVSAEDDFMGAARMYEKAGFELWYEAGGRLVMRKKL